MRADKAHEAGSVKRNGLGLLQEAASALLLLFAVLAADALANRCWALLCAEPPAAAGAVAVNVAHPFSGADLLLRQTMDTNIKGDLRAVKRAREGGVLG